MSDLKAFFFFFAVLQFLFEEGSLQPQEATGSTRKKLKGGRAGFVFPVPSQSLYLYATRREVVKHFILHFVN